MHTMQPAHIFPSKRSAVALMALLSALFVIPANGQSDSDDGDSGTKAASGQVLVIGGNIYGGGSEGDTKGNTTVTVRGCRVEGNVFGGARMADVGGHAFVNIDGEHTTGQIEIKAVYGGNDIAGTVGTKIDPEDTRTSLVPEELTQVVGVGTNSTYTKAEKPELNVIDNSWNAFVRSTSTPTEDATHRVVVGSVFGGGNGDYDYVSTADFPEAGQTTHYVYPAGSDHATATPLATKVTMTGEAGFVAPALAKTYLELLGGCLAHIYGGGNSATVTDATTICLNNPGASMQEVLPSQGAEETDAAYQERLLADFFDLARFVDLSTFQGNYSSLDYNAARVFGGNNKVPMAIRPVWNLQRGKIRDLYSGGNEGNMTYPHGLLLDISPQTAYNDSLIIYNV